MNKLINSIFVLFFISVVFQLNVNAAEDIGAANWLLSEVSVEHKKVCFSLDNVENAQSAMAIIKEYGSDEIIMELPFSITSASQKFELDINEGYLEGGKSYVIYVQDNVENRTEEIEQNCQDHSYSFYTYGDENCYPNCYIGKIFPKEDIDIHVKAEVQFKDYKGTIDKEGNVYVEYPKQEKGAFVNIVFYDEYGCSSTKKMEVSEKKFYFSEISAFHDGIVLNYSRKLEADERLCVLVDGKEYYSDYGVSGEGVNYKKVISFPETKETVLDLWMESKYGSLSEIKKCEIEDCDLKNCKYTWNAFRSMIRGVIEPNEKGYIPKKVVVEIDGKSYSGEVEANGKFNAAYPAQKTGARIDVLFYDNHGCSYKTWTNVNNSLEYTSVNVDYVLPCKAIASGVYKGVRLCAKVEGKIYYSEYSDKNNVVTVAYPQQNVGADVVLWYEMEDTSKSKEDTYKVFSGAYSATMTARTTNCFGVIGIGDVGEFDDYDAGIVSAYVIIDGSKYDCSLVEKMTSNGDAIYDSDEYESEEDEEDGAFYLSSGKYYEYSVSYPVKKLGSKVMLYFTDENGITQSTEKVLENIPPKIKMKTLNSNSTKISGTTAANSEVKIKIGKNCYKAKSNKEGKFSKKIKPQKSGTKIKISVLSKEGYFSDVTVKVKKAEGWIELNSNIYKSTKTVSCFVENAKKGDKVKVKIGNKSYTKKITKTKKYYTIKVKISPGTAGASVTVTLTDRFGKKKDCYKDIVYIGDEIYKGMSEKNALLTTWGKPVRKNDYGLGFEQWVFESGKTTMYVYVKAGVVYNIQKLNY